MKRVLSIDGGGIRGAFAAHILAAIEQRTGPLSKRFDLIAGTSTGGILAAGLAHTTDGKTPTYSAAQLLDLYRLHGAEIFSRRWYDPVAALKVKFDSVGIERVLQQYYGQVRLSAALTDVIITAADEVNWTDRLFKSRKAKIDPSEDFPLWYTSRATSAAPTYFPNIDGLIDGGMLGATNPAMIALTEARIVWPGEDILLVSVGTGSHDGHVDAKASEDWGQLHLLPSIVAMLLDLPGKIVERSCCESLPAGRYFRIQGKLADSSADAAMDNASAGNIQALIDFADRTIEAHKSDIDAIVAT